MHHLAAVDVDGLVGDILRVIPGEEDSKAHAWKQAHGRIRGTSESSLAAAAVHAGVLKVGQSGIVKVTTIPSYPGSSARNGITSSAWGSCPGFRVEALDDEDQDLNEAETGNATPAKTPQPPHCAFAPGTEAPKGTPREDPFHPSMPHTPNPPAGLPLEACERIASHRNARFASRSRY